MVIFARRHKYRSDRSFFESRLIRFAIIQVDPFFTIRGFIVCFSLSSRHEFCVVRGHQALPFGCPLPPDARPQAVPEVVTVIARMSFSPRHASFLHPKNEQLIHFFIIYLIWLIISSFFRKAFNSPLWHETPSPNQKSFWSVSSHSRYFIAQSMDSFEKTHHRSTSHCSITDIWCDKKRSPQVIRRRFC